MQDLCDLRFGMEESTLLGAQPILGSGLPGLRVDFGCKGLECLSLSISATQVGFSFVLAPIAYL